MIDINILCATDDNYAALCGIMLTSLFECNKNINFNIFILVNGVSVDNESKFIKLADKYGAKLKIIKIQNEYFSNCPIWENDHLSVAAYYRLVAPDLLPNDIDKILYLDCDVIINGSIVPLWETNIDNFALGAVVDAQFYNSEFYFRLGLLNNGKYFNSGILLMNIKYWREFNVTKRCFDCISSHRQKLKYHDQDTLNFVLHDETLFLPIRYNLQTPFLMSAFMNEYKDFKYVILQECEKATVIHFIGSGKPWLGNSNHPFKDYFNFYYKKSFWKNNHFKKVDIDIFRIIKKYIYVCLCFLRLKKEYNSYIIKKQKINKKRNI